MSTYMRIENKSDLVRVKSTYREQMAGYRHQALICAGGSCLSSDSKSVKDELIEELKKNGLENEIAVIDAGCMGTCDIGPVMIVLPEQVFYTNLSLGDMKTIAGRHFVNGEIVLDKTYFDANERKFIPFLNDIPFFKEQIKIALRNCGSIDCNSLAAYVANEGYFALAKILEEYSPVDVVSTIKDSGLRGRGGGGFPTGLKLEAGLNAAGEEKYLVCNADEGDPGAFMDRSLIEGDPHGIIEGMMIAAYAMGARHGFVYVRAEYPLAIERLSEAIAQAREAGLLGSSILGSAFDFDLEIRIGAGAFVCGEETALMNSIEGKRGEPRQKPPFPFQSGIFGKPTIINNVETYANLPPIILNGSDWFRSFGTEGSPGTKVFALAGDIKNTGIVEVPMGRTLGDIVFGVGGGIPNGKSFKAAQTGGPSGGCITKEFLNTPVDYDSLKELGAIMGSGGLVIMNEDTCMVDMARFFMEFVQDESCGKCVPCRLGSKRMLEILEKIVAGKGEPEDLELLYELSETMRESAICGLGQTAPNPVLSTLHSFPEEYEEHISEGYCRAGICSDLFISPCENACPAGVNVPGYVALIAAGRMRDAYNLVRKENPFPAICGRVCTHPCESKCRRSQLDEPIAICDLKRYVADYVMNHDEPYLDLVFPKKNINVGIIGAGPSGLTCAYYLSRLGYDVDVYEAQPIAGGILAFGIPEYRLPLDILQKEIHYLQQTGFKIHLNTEIGADLDFRELQDKHAAIYIATGTQFSQKVDIPGEDLAGVIHGLDFLRDVNLARPIALGKKVVVIGGGNTAIDTARVAIRLGAEEVKIVYRRNQEDMPADKREIADALEEGIELIELAAPVAFLGTDKVEGVKCIRMELGSYDKSGRKKPLEIDGSEFVIEADTVIPAISQYSDLPFISKEEVELTPWGAFVTDSSTLMTTIPGIFAGGDVARGSDVAITAIADGKKAAQAIDSYLGGDGMLNTGEDINIPSPEDDIEITEHERFAMKYLEPEKRKDNFSEVALGYHRLNAIAEAMRCLRCDRRG